MQPRRGFSYHEWTANQSDLEARGRFAAVNKATVTPAPMPALPEGSPWHADPVGQEGPLGYSIDEQPPVGEPHELAKSVAMAALGSPPGVVEQAGWPAKAVSLSSSGEAASSIEPATSVPQTVAAAKHGVASFERRRG
jgi:hypothetical protein